MTGELDKVIKIEEDKIPTHVVIHNIRDHSKRFYRLVELELEDLLALINKKNEKSGN